MFLVKHTVRILKFTKSYLKRHATFSSKLLHPWVLLIPVYPYLPLFLNRGSHERRKCLNCPTSVCIVFSSFCVSFDCMTKKSLGINVPKPTPTHMDLIFRSNKFLMSGRNTGSHVFSFKTKYIVSCPGGHFL